MLTATADDVLGPARRKELLQVLLDEEVVARSILHGAGIVEVTHLGGTLRIVGKTAAVTSEACQ
jgi:hypothetical protein